MVESVSTASASSYQGATRHLVSEEHVCHVSNHTLKNECPDIYLTDHAMDLKFSPTCNMLSMGQITGKIRIYCYDEGKMDNLVTFSHHKESVRTLDYNPAGNILYAGSKDQSLSVMSNGRVEGVLKQAHPEAISKVLHIENDHVIASGDDDGLIRIWDLRMAQAGDAKKACALELKEHEGTI